VAKEANFEFHQNVFTFEFLALNMIHSENNQYKYMMEGFEDSWNFVGSKREATYTNLNPGEYIFRVIASNNDNEWNEEGASIKVVISPPWWKTLAARMTLIMAVVLSIIALISLRTRQLNKQKMELAEQVKQRTNEISKSNKTKDTLLSIIAHDLISPFNAILGFSDILSTSYEELNEEERIKMIFSINTSSKILYALLENLLNWAKTQTGQMKPNPEKIELEIQVRETINIFVNQLNDKNLTVNIKNTCEQSFLAFADKNMIRTILRNLISNAIKFSNEDGNIDITISRDEKMAKVSIQDTGVGMNAEDLIKLKAFSSISSREGTKGEKGSGLGLILCNDFIQRNGGEFKVESKPEKGSTLMFTVPLA
jgi:signal transduction histidine kinase